jgi:hypothetical protein
MMVESSPFGFNNFSFTPTESSNLHGSNSASAVSFPVLIYEGSVNYWRTRETIHLSIYEHQKISSIAPHPEVSVCVEVVAYHPKIEIEAPHIYLSSSLLYDKFLRNELEESKLREQNNSQSTKKTNIVKCNNKFTQECIRNYVLTRVGVLPATTTALASSVTLDRSLTQSDSIEVEDKGSLVFTIGFTPQLSDSDDGQVILKSKPPHLGELPVNSQARKESEMLKRNFNKEMMLLRLDTSIISEDCNKAEKMSDLAMTTINLFEEMEAQTTTDKDSIPNSSETVPKARKRWIDAIKQILTQNKTPRAAYDGEETGVKSTETTFAFKLSVQNVRKSSRARKDSSSDINSKGQHRGENATRRTEKVNEKLECKELSEEKEREYNEAKRERIENFYFSAKPLPAKRKSLHPPDDTLVRTQVKDNMFSNLSRVRRVTAGDVSCHIIAAAVAKDLKEIKEKAPIPRQSLAASGAPVRNKGEGTGDAPPIGGRGKVRKTPATPCVGEIDHINRVRKANGVLPRLVSNPADKLIANTLEGRPISTLPSISFSNMKNAI